MSITVRTWTDEELENIHSGKDYWLATIFMNMTTLTAKEHKHYPYSLRREYRVDFGIAGKQWSEKVYATDDMNLVMFVKAEYKWDLVIAIVERIVKYRDVPLNKEVE